MQGLLWQWFDRETNGEMLDHLFEKGDPDQVARTAFGDEEKDKTNADVRLEMIATLALAKAFSDSNWEADRHGLAVGWKFRDVLTLRKEGVTLHVRKGFATKVKKTDRTRELLKPVDHKACWKQLLHAGRFHCIRAQARAGNQR